MRGVKSQTYMCFMYVFWVCGGLGLVWFWYSRCFVSFCFVSVNCSVLTNAIIKTPPNTLHARGRTLLKPAADIYRRVTPVGSVNIGFIVGLFLKKRKSCH